MPKNNQTYNSSDIQVLEGLDAVRMRPGMYIGTTGSRGLHHLLWEILDNAIDEVSGGHAHEVIVTLHADGSATVEEDGRGIPVDPHPQLGVSGVEVVFTQLHAGGKFGGGAYVYSGGLHGVGASVVNALSEWLTVEVCVDWSRYRMEFRSVYDPEKDKILAGHPVAPLERVGGTRKRGSRITFMPDKRVFESTEFQHDIIARRLRELAYLIGGVRITLRDERPGNPPEQVFQFSGGLSDFVRYLNEDKTPLHPDPIVLSGRSGDVLVACAFQYTDSYTESIFSYVNNIPTAEGGTHETGFKAAITRVLSDYARKQNLLKEKDKLAGEDIREGITALLSVSVPTPQFEGQTKGRLGNTEVRSAVESVIAEALALYVEDLKNTELVQKILEKAIRAAQVREAARKARDMARTKSSLEYAPLVGKLSSCTGRNPEENELFIVEGDSAGGNARQGRDRRFQAILPLRGKPLNAEKKRLDQVLGNEEFRTIITALGCGIEGDFDRSSLKYHRVIILSDADQDGAHIRAILLTFFFRYMRDLITEGHVYIGMPPLYRVMNARGNQHRYAFDDAQLAAAAKEMGRGYSVQRYKGLGEMDAGQLWDTTLDPSSRTLLQVTLEDATEADRMVTLLMGEKVEPRKAYISQHANFNRVDNFEKKRGRRIQDDTLEGAV